PMVGATGFEPATSCSRSRRATGLRYAPPTLRFPCSPLVNDAPRRTRTSNLLIRSQMLYPIELWAPETRSKSQTYFRSKVESTATLRDRPDLISTTTIQTKTPRKTAGNGRYKTRTCDLHDVNVAL